MFAVAIIERELRVRSRRQLTSWLRVGVGLAAAIMAMSHLNWVSRGLGAASAGKQMFLILAWMAFAFCILEGARCAADVISREKREGTLGFLILTELSGFEVALGKFFASSITSFYALLALFPAMAISLAAGGVTAGEFWRTQAALLDALFLAVAAGLWVSARTEDDTRALLGAIGLLSGLVLLPALLGGYPGFKGWPNPSPGTLMWSADDTNYGAAPGRFWGSLLLVQVLAWAFLLMAGRSIATCYRSEPDTRPMEEHPHAPEAAGYRIPPSLHSDPEKARRDLLEEHPVRWLAKRHGESRALIWLAVLLQPLFHLGFQLVLPRFSGTAATAGMISAAFFAVWLTAQFILATVASRRMVEEHGAGTLEVLLASPLSARQIVLGHWWGLWQLLRWPLLISCIGPAAVQILVRYVIEPRSGAVSGFWICYMLLSPFIYASYLLAVCWLAMWLGVRARSPARAASFTVLWTMLVPYLGNGMLGLALSYIRPATSTSTVPNWMYVVTLLHLFGGLLYSVAILFWARRQLLTHLREDVSVGARRRFRRLFPQRTVAPHSF